MRRRFCNLNTKKISISFLLVYDLFELLGVHIRIAVFIQYCLFY